MMRYRTFVRWSQLELAVHSVWAIRTLNLIRHAYRICGTKRYGIASRDYSRLSQKEEPSQKCRPSQSSFQSHSGHLNLRISQSRMDSERPRPTSFKIFSQLRKKKTLEFESGCSQLHSITSSCFHKRSSTVLKLAQASNLTPVSHYDGVTFHRLEQ